MEQTNKNPWDLGMRSKTRDAINPQNNSEGKVEDEKFCSRFGDRTGFRKDFKNMKLMVYI